jgi:hypothetical protein
MKVSKGSLLYWMHGTIFLSLIQLWTALVWENLAGEGLTAKDVFLSGNLIFFANATCMCIANECKRRSEAIGQSESGGWVDVLTTVVVPQISLWFSTILYIGVLSFGRFDVSIETIYLWQTSLVLVVICYSAWYFQMIERDIEFVRQKLKQEQKEVRSND